MVDSEYNALRSAFDVNKRLLDNVLITLEEAEKHTNDDILRRALNRAAAEQRVAITEIGLKCGYKT